MWFQRLVFDDVEGSVALTTFQHRHEQIKHLEAQLKGTKHTSSDYDTRLTSLQQSLEKAALAKAAVDEKLSNALKVSERAYQSLVLADQRQMELEEEIRRLKALRNASADAARVLDSAQKMSDEERDKFEALLIQVRVGRNIASNYVAPHDNRSQPPLDIQVASLEDELSGARDQLRYAEQLKRDLSVQIAQYKAECSETAEKVRPVCSRDTTRLTQSNITLPP